MKKNKFLSSITILALVFSVQISGLHVAQSAVVSTPANVVVRAGTNTNYLNGSLTVILSVELFPLIKVTN